MIFPPPNPNYRWMDRFNHDAHFVFNYFSIDDFNFWQIQQGHMPSFGDI
jgi:hypothetical protein